MISAKRIQIPAPPQGRTGLAGPGLVALAILVTVGVTAGTLAAPRDLLLLVVAAVALIGWVVLCLIDTAWLPTVAFVLFVLIPLVYLPVSTHDGLLNPSSPVLVLFVVRSIIENRSLKKSVVALPLGFLMLWIVIATLLSPDKFTSASWSVPFLLLVGIPALLLPGWDRAARLVKESWIIMGGVLGVFGIIEFAIHDNPIYGRYYATANPGIGETSGIYRITTTLGHPITNGLFFALAALLALGAYFNGRRGYVLPCAVLSVLATFLSFSRGPSIALVIGLVVLGLCFVGAGKIPVTRRMLAISSVLVAVLAVGGLAVSSLRGASGESSTQSHLETVVSGEELVRQYFPLGGGPGLADTHKRLLPSGDKARGVESSPLQLAISLGLPGIVFMVWVLLSAGVSSFRYQPEVFAGLIVYIVATLTYNLFESNRPALIILGVLLGLSARAGAYGDP